MVCILERDWLMGRAWPNSQFDLQRVIEVGLVREVAAVATVSLAEWLFLKREPALTEVLDDRIQSLHDSSTDQDAQQQRGDEPQVHFIGGHRASASQTYVSALRLELDSPEGLQGENAPGSPAASDQLRLDHAPDPDGRRL